jgi:hypothetical protein
MNKILLWFVITLATIYSSIWVFNHVNAWLGFLIIIIYVYLFINFIKKHLTK